MLSTILWIIGGIILASILIGLIKIFLVILGVKKMLEVVKEEVEQLPQDYQGVRKEVQNENSSISAKATSAAKGVTKVGWRWFKRWL